MEDKIFQEIDKYADIMIDNIKRIVCMPSVETTAQDNAPFGKNIANTLDAVLDLAEQLGFQTHHLDHYIGWAQTGEGDDYIGVIGHLDVVPVGEGWQYPPFEACEEDGYIYGRGILDNKGPILSCLYALYAIQQLRIELKRPVRIIFGCDEESGFEDLKYYLKYEKPPLMGWTPDCKYPVVYGERGRAVIEITAPQNNVAEFFEFVNTYFMNVKNNGESLGLNYTNIEFGTNEMRQYQFHYIDECCVFTVTFSYPIGITLTDILNKIQQRCPTFKVQCVLHYPPVLFKKNCTMVKMLQKAYERVTGLDGTPVTTTGGTYAKLMPNIVPFGPSFPGQKGIGHLPNEWMKRSDLILNAKIYALGIIYLANLKEEEIWKEL